MQLITFLSIGLMPHRIASPPFPLPRFISKVPHRAAAAVAKAKEEQKPETERTEAPAGEGAEGGNGEEQAAESAEGDGKKKKQRVVSVLNITIHISPIYVHRKH